MSDTTLNKFFTCGTNADRLAFVPDPPAGINTIYIWYETDTGDTYLYDSIGASWSLVTSGGGGTGDVVGPGASANNGITRFDGITGKLIQDTSGPLLEDDGRISTLTDPTGAQDATTKFYVDDQIANANVAGAAQTSFLVSGGQVIWLQDYDFLVSAASYYINGILYNSLESSITLDASDATNDRIDSIAVDNTGTVVKVTGTAAPNPSEPDINPGTQLKLGIVFVPATSTQPTVGTEVVYFDASGGPTEWNWTSSGASIVVNSANNPKAPSTADIEGTAVAAGVYAQGEIPSSSYDPSQANLLILYIRSKATWANNRGLSVSLRTGGVLQGSTVNINRTGSFGFDSSSTGSYQLVAIPISLFVIPAGSTITQVRITTFGAGHGFYIGDISFQEGGITQPPTGITQAQADARYLQRSNNLSDVVSAASATANLNAMVGDTGAGGTKGLVPAPAAGDALLGKFLSAHGTWVTPQIESGTAQEYFFDDAASDIATYFRIITSPGVGAEDIDSRAVVVGDGEVLIDAYAAESAFNTTVIPAGNWFFHLWRYVSSAAGVSEIVIRVYNRAVGGAETELFNVSTGEINDTTVAEQHITSTQTVFTVLATDRLVVKLFAKTDSVVARTISFVHNGSTHYSYFLTPFVIPIPDFVGDSGSGGVHGLVPAPAAGDAAAGKFLKADGNWAAPTFAEKVRSITLVIDGGGSSITTGIKGDIEVPFACTITAVTMLADQSGSIIVDIWKDSYANYPPTDADTITAAAPPTISGATKFQDSTLTGWTTSISAGDTLRFNVDSAATITRVSVQLTVQP